MSTTTKLQIQENLQKVKEYCEMSGNAMSWQGANLEISQLEVKYGEAT